MDSGTLLDITDTTAHSAIHKCRNAPCTLASYHAKNEPYVNMKRREMLPSFLGQRSFTRGEAKEETVLLSNKANILILFGNQRFQLVISSALTVWRFVSAAERKYFWKVSYRETFVPIHLIKQDDAKPHITKASSLGAELDRLPNSRVCTIPRCSWILSQLFWEVVLPSNSKVFKHIMFFQF